MSVPKMAIICTGAVAIAGIGWMCQAAAPAGWKVETVLPEMELEYGGRQVTKKVSGRMQAELRMVIFDESQCQLRVA